MNRRRQKFKNNDFGPKINQPLKNLMKSFTEKFISADTEAQNSQFWAKQIFLKNALRHFLVFIEPKRHSKYQK